MTSRTCIVRMAFDSQRDIHLFHGKKNEDNWHMHYLNAMEMTVFPSDDLYIFK